MYRYITTAVILFVIAGSLYAERSQPVKVNEDHATRWNRFVDGVYALHKQQLKRHQVNLKTRDGGYHDNPRFYREETYTDRSSGRLLSVVQWEQRHPDRIHAIDVYIYDHKGRVIRDYSALYLTFSRNAPQQTLINLHAYNGELHAWRQFDASDERIHENCRGRYMGKQVDIEFDDLDIISAEDEPHGPFTRADYKACFKGLPTDSAGSYLTPQ